MANEIEKKVGSGLGWNVKHDSVYVGLKGISKVLGTTIVDGMLLGTTTAAQFAVGSVAGVLLTPGALIAMAGITAVSALTSMMDYFHEKDEMVELYKEEAAAKLRKSREDVNVKDMKILACGDHLSGLPSNHTITNGLRRIEDKRDLNITTSIFASLGSFIAVGSITKTFGINAMVVESLANTAIAGTFLATTVAPIAVGAAIGLAAYHLLRAPIRKLADALWDYEKETGHEKILTMERALERGKAITREDVFSTFITANPRLAEHIKQSAGREYDDLRKKDREKIAEHFAPILNLDRFVEDINKGRVCVTELAFAVEGQRSGVLPKDIEIERNEAPSRLKAMIANVAKFFRREKATHEAPAEEAAKATVSMPQYDNPAPQTSFVERVAQAPEKQMGFVEKLQESRQQAAQIAPQQLS